MSTLASQKKKIRLCLVDMNNGHQNQAVRCFHVLVDSFFAKVRAKNPDVECELVRVEPRNKDELPPTDCDFYLSTGGPGGPYDHDADPWLVGYKKWLDAIVEGQIKHGASAPSLMGVCYTFELLVRHFEVSAMVPRSTRKFGVMPVYMTEDGLRHPLTARFKDRLFAFEHRNWEAIDLDEKKLASLGGKLLAQESRDGLSKGRGLLAFDFAPGVEGTQFHPEADKGGVVAWVRQREQAAAFVDAYGRDTYERMLKTLDNPLRLGLTFSTMLPGWLARKFNGMADERGFRPLDAPVVDLEMFDGDAPTAQSIAHPSLFHMPAAKPLASFDFDDVDVPIASEFTRPLQPEIEASVADEGQSL